MNSRTYLFITQTIESEGRFVDHPFDKGGPTNLGITARFLAEYLQTDVSMVTVEMIKAITHEDAIDIYHTNIWLKANIDLLPSTIQYLIFDWMVMSGRSRPAKFLQRMVGATPDGIIGPMTAHRVNEAMALNFANDVVTRAIRYFIRIVRRYPDQRVFLEGWFNRFVKHYDFGE